MGCCDVLHIILPCQGNIFEKDIVGNGKGFILGQIPSSVNDIIISIGNDFHGIRDIRTFDINYFDVADLCAGNLHGIFNDHVSCSSIIRHLCHFDRVMAGVPDIISLLVRSLCDLQARRVFLDRSRVSCLFLRCITAPGQRRVGDFLSDGIGPHGCGIIHGDLVRIRDIKPCFDRKSIFRFCVSDLHLISDILIIQFHDHGLCVNLCEISLCKLVFDDDIFCHDTLPLLCDFDMVVHIFAIVVNLFIRFFADGQVRRVRGDGFICRYLQCLIGYCGRHVVDLFAGKVFIGDDHLVLDPHGCFLCHADVIRVPGILFFRCLAVCDIPLTVVSSLYQMLFRGQLELVVLDIRQIIFFGLLDDFSIRI